MRMLFGLRNVLGTYRRPLDIPIVYSPFAVRVKPPDWHCHNSWKHWSTCIYQPRGAHLDASLRCRCHYQTEEKRNFLKHNQLPGSHDSPWRTGRFTTHYRRNPQMKALHEYFGTRIITGLVIRLPMFCTQLRTYGSTTKQKVAKRWTDSVQGTSRRRAARPELLKQKLVTPPVLDLTKTTGTYILDIAACNGQVCCPLVQQQRGVPDKPIGYWWRSLNKA